MWTAVLVIGLFPPVAYFVARRLRRLAEAERRQTAETMAEIRSYEERVNAKSVSEARDELEKLLPAIAAEECVHFGETGGTIDPALWSGDLAWLMRTYGGIELGGARVGPIREVDIDGDRALVIGETEDGIEVVVFRNDVKVYHRLRDATGGEGSEVYCPSVYHLVILLIDNFCGRRIAEGL